MRSTILVPVLLPVLLLVACAEDKDPTQCPSDPACTTGNPGTNPPPATTNDSVSSTNESDDDNTVTNATPATSVSTPATSGEETFEPTTATFPTSEALTEFDPSVTSETLTEFDPTFSSSDPSSDPSGDPSTSGDPYGKCGWLERGGYYDCEDNGAVPGAEDPNGEYPILCPDGLVEGAPCTDNGPVGNVGCCTLTGQNYFCDTQDSMTIFILECGA